MSDIDVVVVEVPSPIEVLVEPPAAAPLVEVITDVGIAGPRGPQGPPGDVEDALGIDQVQYRHVQAQPSSVWVIQHGLAYKPNVTVVDPAGTRVFGDEDHSVAGQVTVTFRLAFAGEAYAS